MRPEDNGYSGTMSNSRLPYNNKNQNAKDSAYMEAFEMVSTSPDQYNYNYSEEYLPDEYPSQNWLHAFKDSFKRAPTPYIDPSLTDEEKKILLIEHSALKRRLHSRHLQMIAIGGSIGAGLFVGSGDALSTAGPASTLISYALSGAILYCTVQAIGELAVAFPISGSFIEYNSRFISPSVGFTMAWNYVLDWVIVVPLELVAASMTIQYWDSSINPSAWVILFLFTLVLINLFGVRGYGEAEYIMCLIKVLTLIGFIIMGISLNCGGGPLHTGYIGGKYWRNPGAFNNGFKGFCTTFTNSCFSYSGAEVIGLTSAETVNPKQVLPKATKQVFWRITLFYMVSLTIVGLLVPYTDPRLLDGDSSVDITASPFVIAIKNAGIKGLPSVMNAVIMIAVFSVANTSVFAASRAIVSLADQGFAPGWLGYIDRSGRPLAGIAISIAFGLLGFLAASPVQDQVFTWLLSLSGLSTIFTWGAICICHIRFRAALKLRGRSVDELSYTSQTGVTGSYIGCILMLFMLVAEFWVSLFPIGSPVDAESFFETWLCLPFTLLFWIAYMVWKRDFRLWIPTRDIDIDSGRGVMDLQLLREEVAEEKAFIAAQPFLFRVYKYWC